jgi:Bacterial type II/III secretion system short domain
MFRLAVLLFALASLLIAAGESTASTEPCEPEPAIIIKVVPLSYAHAGELAYTLALVAPSCVRIAPYYPTNSLVIAGPPSVVEQLIEIIKPSARD